MTHAGGAPRLPQGWMASADPCDPGLERHKYSFFLSYFHLT